MIVDETICFVLIVSLRFVSLLPKHGGQETIFSNEAQAAVNDTLNHLYSLA